MAMKRTFLRAFPGDKEIELTERQIAINVPGAFTVLQYEVQFLFSPLGPVYLNLFVMGPGH